MGISKVIRSFIILIILVLAFYYITNSITSTTGYLISDTNTEFENCLKEKDVKLFVEDYNIKKLEDLKSSEYLSYIDIVGCPLNQITCMREGITNYPTWIIEGQKAEGDIDTFRLADLAGCYLI